MKMSTPVHHAILLKPHDMKQIISACLQMNNNVDLSLNQSLFQNYIFTL